MEIWEDIKGYEGLYRVSNLGNVLSLNYNKTNTCHQLSQATNRFGYKCVTLYKNGKQSNKKVHRLVAEAFISNDDSIRTLVNHKDGNKANNNVENLEWCTYSENLVHAYKNGLNSPNRSGNGRKRKVKCIETGIVYNSITEASKALNIRINNISQCCLGVREHTHNLHFSFI